MPSFPPLTHVALTVRDLAVSAPWYQALIDAAPMLEEDTDAGFRHVIWPLGDGHLLGIHQHTVPTDGPFSEHRVGLDHLAFNVGSRAELSSWQARLDELDIEHSGIIDVPYGSVLNFRDPDGIALEFFAPPGS